VTDRTGMFTAGKPWTECDPLACWVRAEPMKYGGFE
jgi:hypothetical protein